MSRFRQEISTDLPTYCLLFRALLLFHQNETLRTDCSIALFLLSFCEYIVGAGQHLSAPAICSRLQMPINVSFDWTHSPFNAKSKFELEMQQQKRRDRSTVWQRIRLIFATLWFDKFENISSNNYDAIYKFDPVLKLTDADLSLIRATSISAAVHYNVQAISNASGHANVRQAVANLISYTTLAMMSTTDLLNRKMVVSALQRFVTSVPNTPMDEETFVAVLRLMEHLVLNGNT